MSKVDHVYNVAMKAASEQKLSNSDFKKLQSKISLHILKSSYTEEYGYDDLDEEL